MNDETLVALRNLARARSLYDAATAQETEAHQAYRAAAEDTGQRRYDLHQAEHAFDGAVAADRGLLAEAVLGTETADRLMEVHQDIASDPSRMVSVEEGRARIAGHPLVDAIDVEVARARADEAVLMQKGMSQTCMVGWPDQDCRKPPGHGGRHTWEVTPEELAEAETARSSEATAALVLDAAGRMLNDHGRELQDGDPLTREHHPFVPDPDGRCARHLGPKFDSHPCAKDPNAPCHLLYAGDGNTRVDYTSTPKGSD